MGEKTGIEWCSHTFNPWRGCTKVSDGCKNCYAEQMSGRNPRTLGKWGPLGERVIAAESYWKMPHKWNRESQAAGERRRVFCASLADVFEDSTTMPAESWLAVCKARERLFRLIEETANLDWLLLTKRPQNVMWHFGSMWWGGRIPANVWIGTSVEDQKTADERMPHLLRIPAAVRFLSCEPLLSPIDFSDHDNGVGGPFSWLDLGIHWTIAGGESGPGARPMHPDWARSLRDQCAEAAVPFLFKQWGEWAPHRPVAGGDLGGDIRSGKVQHFRAVGELDGHFRKGDCYIARVGKKRASRLLDGVLHDGYPVRSEP